MFSNVVVTSHSSCVFLYLFSSANISQSIINLQECRLRQACWPSVTGYSFVQTSKIFECC